MYSDNPVIYETVIDEYIIYYIILAVIAVALTIFTYIALAKIFKKANRSGIYAFIPIYNIIVLLEIVNLPKMYLALLLVPFLNIVIYIKIAFSLARLFKKSKLFAVGLLVLPFIYYPVLGFSESEYIGINIVAMEGKSTVIDIPKIVDEEESNPTVNESFDENSRNINISIGGGVYQKDYTNNLLNVDEKQTIVDKQPATVDVKPQLIDEPSMFVKKVVEQPKVEKPVNNNYGINMPGLISDNQQLIPSMNSQPNITNSSTTISNQTPSPAPGFKTCPKCGATVKNDTKTCFLCGAQID